MTRNRFLGISALLVAFLICVSAVVMERWQDPTSRRKQARNAQQLRRVPNGVKKVEVETMESAPPQFDVLLTLLMPEPKWTLVVDGKPGPDSESRIKVHITGKRPKVDLPQIVTDTIVRLRLGTMKEGDYLLDVWYRSSANAPYKRRGVVMLEAVAGR